MTNTPPEPALDDVADADEDAGELVAPDHDLNIEFPEEHENDE